MLVGQLSKFCNIRVEWCSLHSTFARHLCHSHPTTCLALFVDGKVRTKKVLLVEKERCLMRHVPSSKGTSHTIDVWDFVLNVWYRLKVAIWQLVAFILYINNIDRVKRWMSSQFMICEDKWFRLWETNTIFNI